MRRLALDQSVRIADKPDIIGTVVDSLPGWVQVVHTHPRAIRGNRQWYAERRVQGHDNKELRWEESA